MWILHEYPPRVLLYLRPCWLRPMPPSQTGRSLRCMQLHHIPFLWYAQSFVCSLVSVSSLIKHYWSYLNCCLIKPNLWTSYKNKRNIVTIEKRWNLVILNKPGVKAPGTPKRTPFLPLNKSWMFTLLPGVFSNTVTFGSCCPSLVYGIKNIVRKF